MSMKNKPINTATYIVCSFGALLHVCLAFSQSRESAFNFIVTPLLNTLPYVLCLILLTYSTRSLIALCAAVAILMTDIFLFRNFIVEKRTLGYALVGLFTPLWKLGLALPIGSFVGLIIDKYIFARRQ